MARVKSAELWALWRDRLRRYQEADLTVAEFCDWEGLSAAAFYVWRKKLQADSDRPPFTPPRKTVEKLASRSAPAFVEILSGLNRPHDTVAKVVMTLTDGTRVELPASDRELIAHVVSAVAAAHSAAALQAGER